MRREQRGTEGVGSGERGVGRGEREGRESRGREWGFWALNALAVGLFVGVAVFAWQWPLYQERVERRAAEAARERRELTMAEAALADPPEGKMADWVVSGAGDSSYNGEYSEAGTYNGQPYYVGPAPANNRYLFYYSADSVWCLNDFLGGGTGMVAYIDGTSLPGTWGVDQGPPPAPTVTADVWVRFGSSAEEAALWDDAANHRWSKYGFGGFKDMVSGKSGGHPPLHVQFQGTPYASYCIRLKLSDHTWWVHGPYTAQPGVNSIVIYDTLPFAKNPTWADYLGEAGAKAITVELVRAPDGTLAAVDQAAFTMFIPHLVWSEPDGGATVHDQFTVQADFDEWYDDSNNPVALRFYLAMDGNEYSLGDEGCSGHWAYIGAKEPVARGTEYAVDLLKAGRWGEWTGGSPVYVTWSYPFEDGPPEGSLTLRVKSFTWSRDRGWVDGPVEAADRTVTYAKAYEVTLTAPDEGAELFVGGIEPGCRIQQSWKAGSYVRWYALRSGSWIQVWEGYVHEAGYPPGYRESQQEPQRNRLANIWLLAGDAGLKVEWGYYDGDDWIVLASDSITIAVVGVDPPPLPPPPPLPEGTSWVQVDLPPNGAQVQRQFTCALSWGGFSDGVGSLSLIAIREGVGSYTLKVASVNVGSGAAASTYMVDIGPVAEPGTYSIYAQIISGTEIASDAVSVTLKADAVPSVLVSYPPEGASVPQAFTAYIYYSRFTAGAGHLTIVATPDGEDPITLYDQDVTLVAGENKVLDAACDLGDVTGAVTFEATVSNGGAGETASDSTDIVVTTAEPPNPQTPWVTLEQPAEGSTVAQGLSVFCYYGSYSAGTGHLKITATRGSNVYVLYDQDVTLAEGLSRLQVACTMPNSALCGDYVIEVTLTGPAVESASDSNTVTYDNPSAPVVRITTPENGATVSGQVAITATITDSVGTHGARLYVDGQAHGDAVFTAGYGGTYTFTWETRDFVNGPHALSVRAWNVNLKTGEDSISVILGNSQADATRVFFTKKMGYGLEEADNWGDHPLHRMIEVVLPEDAPEEAHLQYYLYCGWNVPGDSVDFDDYHLFTPGQSHGVPANATTIRWGMKVVPVRSLSYWEVDDAEEIIRLAVASNGDPLLLCLDTIVMGYDTPQHGIYRFSRQSETLVELADLSYLSADPVDMVAADGKVYVGYADRILVLDEDSGDLAFEVLLPSPDEVESITALGTDGTKVYVAADLAAGGARLYHLDWQTPRALADHADSITAITALGTEALVGTDAGKILSLGASGLSLAYSTGEAVVARFGRNGSTVYAGTGNGGKVFERVGGGWRESWDSGWDLALGFGTLSGWLYAGGSGTGGAYLWMQGNDGWAQTILLDGVTGVLDMLSVTESDGHEQLFVATENMGGARLYRVEVAPGSGITCGVGFPRLVFKQV